MLEKPLNQTELKALRFLRNALVHEGWSPSIRDLAQELGYKSPRTAFLVLSHLIDTGWLKRKASGGLQLQKDLVLSEAHVRTVNVPLVGSVACGDPILAEENIEAYVPVSNRLAKPGNRYFLLRAAGDSMNEAAINNGDLMLIRQQSHANNGDRVVALINDEATVKEFFRDRDVVVLKPRSSNKQHKPIIVSDHFRIQGVVVSVLPAGIID
jgi:repressor LexA